MVYRAFLGTHRSFVLCKFVEEHQRLLFIPQVADDSARDLNLRSIAHVRIQRGIDVSLETLQENLNSQSLKGT